MIIDLELLKLQKADLLAAIEQQPEEGVKDSLTGILNLLDAIQDKLEDEKDFQLAIHEDPKLLITVEDGSIQNVSANFDLKYAIVEYDNDGINDEPVTVKVHEPDSTLKPGDLFHVELFKGELSAPEKKAKHELKKANF